MLVWLVLGKGIVGFYWLLSCSWGANENVSEGKGMDRFVKGFDADVQSLLVGRINNYAESNNLKIIQVSYATDAKSPEKALVLFEETDC